MIRYSADKISKCLLWETQWWTEKCWNTSVSECEAYRETIAWWKQRSSYLLRCLWQPCDYGFLHSKILKFNSQRLSSSLSIQFKSKVALKIKADDTETTKAIRELKRVWNAFESECITNEIAPPPSPLLFFGSFPSLYSLFSLFFFFLILFLYQARTWPLVGARQFLQSRIARPRNHVPSGRKSTWC